MQCYPNQTDVASGGCTGLGSATTMLVRVVMYFTKQSDLLITQYMSIGQMILCAILIHYLLFIPLILPCCCVLSPNMLGVRQQCGNCFLGPLVY